MANGEFEKFGSGKRRLEMVKVSGLKRFKYNDDTRTNPAGLQLLKEDILANGVLSLLHVDGDTMETIDGNRRRTILQDMIEGTVTEVRAMVYFGLTKLEKDELYASLNEPTRRFSGPNKFASMYLGLNKKVFKATGAKFKKMESLFTDSEMRELIEEHNMGPDALSVAKRAGKYIGKGTTDKVLSKIVLWMYRQHQYLALKKAINPHTGVSSSKIINAIDGNRAIWPRKVEAAA